MLDDGIIRAWSIGLFVLMSSFFFVFVKSEDDNQEAQDLFFFGDDDENEDEEYGYERFCHRPTGISAMNLAQYKRFLSLQDDKQELGDLFSNKPKCIMCFEPIDNPTTFCDRHYYHPGCVPQWFQRQGECVFCKKSSPPPTTIAPFASVLGATGVSEGAYGTRLQETSNNDGNMTVMRQLIHAALLHTSDEDS